VAMVAPFAARRTLALALNTVSMCSDGKLERTHPMPEFDSKNRECFLRDLSLRILTAYVGYNAIRTTDLPGLIGKGYAALDDWEGSGPRLLLPVPAVDPKSSVADDYIICLEDSTQHQMLTRHLRTKHNFTPVAYRKKWDLDPDYPMNSAKYVAKRSKIAKDRAWGQNQSLSEG
jgi:predicted transcriptional regulator